MIFKERRNQWQGSSGLRMNYAMYEQLLDRVQISQVQKGCKPWKEAYFLKNT